MSYFNRQNIVKTDWFSACFSRGVLVEKMWVAKYTPEAVQHSKNVC